MKLQDLAVANPTKQAAKVFESYFGKTVAVDRVPAEKARTMLNSVRNLIREHRRTPEFHSSERNPAYLQLIVMEQALAARVMEVDTANPATQTGGAQKPNQPAMAMQIAQKRKEIDQQIKSLQDQIRNLQQQRNMPAMGMAESRQRLKESEIQQAQVVLASQDMVDQVQKMSEQVSAMQFKDLPALVDQIKNEVGVDQATTFNGDASAALSGLLQNLQGAKQQLEAALGVVTGQAPVVPGADMGAAPVAEPGAELPAPGEEEITATDIDIEEPESEPGATTLGRARR